MLALLFTAAGTRRYDARDEAAVIMASLGWYASGGDDARAVYQWSSPTLDVLQSLAGRTDIPEVKAALALLHRATP